MSRGLYANIHAKRKRIKGTGSKEKMRKPGLRVRLPQQRFVLQPKRPRRRNLRREGHNDHELRRPEVSLQRPPQQE